MFYFEKGVFEVRCCKLSSIVNFKMCKFLKTFITSKKINKYIFGLPNSDRKCPVYRTVVSQFTWVIIFSNWIFFLIGLDWGYWTWAIYIYGFVILGSQWLNSQLGNELLARLKTLICLILICFHMSALSSVWSHLKRVSGGQRVSCSNVSYNYSQQDATLNLADLAEASDDQKRNVQRSTAITLSKLS